MITYVEYDPKSGVIFQSGFSARDHIGPTGPNGGAVLVVDQQIDPLNWRVDPHSKKLTRAPKPAVRLDDFRIAARMALTASDYTQGADAPDHMTADEIAAWRDYRAALRAALKEDDVSKILAAPRDPKGRDVFAHLIEDKK